MTQQTHLQTGINTTIEPGCTVGLAYNRWRHPAIVGDSCLIRTGAIIYADTRIGSYTTTGTRVFIRERTTIGESCLIGTDTIIEGDTEIEDEVVLESGVYVPTHVVIRTRSFLGPRVVLTNDRYPLRMRAQYAPRGPVIERDASIGANATLLPGIRVGEGAVVAAGAVVTKDVPAWSLAVGVPARITDLPETLREPNTIRTRH